MPHSSNLALKHGKNYRIERVKKKIRRKLKIDLVRPTMTKKYYNRKSKYINQINKKYNKEKFNLTKK